jgi:hypothetical protein
MTVHYIPRPSTPPDVGGVQWRHPEADARRVGADLPHLSPAEAMLLVIVCLMSAACMAVLGLLLLGR